ncbi:hypothetical protein HRbin36_01560 [bacterium HR36]|nr:hypothetical protein HRbin36_01560 [bacterium HR36]
MVGVPVRLVLLLLTVRVRFCPYSKLPPPGSMLLMVIDCVGESSGMLILAGEGVPVGTSFTSVMVSCAVAVAAL